MLLVGSVLLIILYDMLLVGSVLFLVGSVLLIILVFCVVFCCVFCFVCLVYPMLPVSLDCPFLNAPSVFSNV